jgi:predicted CXXCH cytochrome family protein
MLPAISMPQKITNPFKGEIFCFDCHREGESRVQSFSCWSTKGCLSCHPPHVAKYKHLINTKDAALCFSCHTKTKETPTFKTPHSPFVEGECNACHNPHGSNMKNILKGRMDTVCYACHTDAKQSF